MRALQLRVEVLELANSDMSNEVLQLKFFGTEAEAPPPLTEKLVADLTAEEEKELSAALHKLTLDGGLTDEQLHDALGDDLATELGDPSAFLPPSPPGSPVTVYAQPHRPGPRMDVHRPSGLDHGLDIHRPIWPQPSDGGWRLPLI